ncbi:DUF3078 domain-containing protein [Hanstruepera ponticola]|uniref:DUF3078 domain-containing protein n=1 Tax=Hanstruepera ponticola TaxID=2042995 RepID=UPI00177F4156|nr:DUF3078 domain-containing protein [Hanstruepera ponticola]
MNRLLALSVFLFTKFIIAQPSLLFFKQEPQINEPIWTQKNKAGVDINEVAFVNWNSGGTNSISALFTLSSIVKYEYRHFIWDNSFLARYGINGQQDQELRKTDDLFEIRSNLGFRRNKTSNWYYSARFSFKSQFSNGYNYPNTSSPISRFMAPGYLFLGGGVEYGKNIEKLSTYFSPLTLKNTFVLDEELSNAGSFGVTPAEFDSDGNLIKDGERVRTELGILFTSAYEAMLFENISIKNFVSFYTDYINDFGNIDVDWEVVFDFKVNSYVKATLGSHLRYDNDVKLLVEVEDPMEDEPEFMEEGASIQWKQMLGVGVVVDF